MKKDLTGQRFGRLTALEPTEDRHRTSVVWRCRCDCGTECRVPSDWLRRGVKRSCGCLQDEARRDDITGQRRGRLTAIRPTDQRRGGKTVWEWRCDCGATVLKTPDMVREGMSTMCPACARRLKRDQGAALAAAQVRDEETGMMPAGLDGLREGRLFRNNTSGVRGVSWHAGRGKWCARISDGGKMKTVGYYDTIDDAARARAEAVKKKYGVKEPDK